MAITPLPLYGGTPPNRTQPTAEFNTNIAAWVSYTTTFQPLFNTFAEEFVDTSDAAVVSISASISEASAQAVLSSGFASSASSSSSSAGGFASQALAAKDLALGAANFKGSWSSLAGPLNVPASVYHNGLTYVLLINLVDVTAFEPTAGATWAIASGDSFRRYVDGILSKATLDLNFAANSYKLYEQYGLEPKQLTSLVSTTRASAANYLSPSVLKLSPVNAARISYSPSTGEPIGLLSEQQTTNKLLYAEDFTNAAWTQSPDIDVNITSNAVIAPDGTTTADKFTEATTTSTFHDIFQSSGTSFTAGVTETLSVFFKSAERNKGALTFSAGTAFTTERGVLFDLDALTATAFGSGATAGIEEYPNGWRRVWVTATPDGTATANVYIRLRDASGLSIYPGVVGYGLYIWGAMLNSGALRTYIKTAGSQVTASADLYASTIPSSDEGTIIVFANGDGSVSGVNQSLFTLSDGTSNNRVLIRRNNTTSGTGYVVVSGGVVQASLNTTAKLYGKAGKFAISWKANKFIGAENAAVVMNDTSGVTPVSITQLVIGASISGAEPLNGTVQRLVYIPRALNGSELQAVTA